MTLEQMEHRRAEAIPLRRANDPEDIAAMVVFLASDECPFMVGSEMLIDGGMSIM